MPDTRWPKGVCGNPKGRPRKLLTELDIISLVEADHIARQLVQQASDLRKALHHAKAQSVKKAASAGV